MHYEFYTAAQDLARSAEKTQDFCKIIKHQRFETLIYQDPRSASHILSIAFNTMSSSDAWESAMAFIQSDAALEMANSYRPEALIPLLVNARRKMTEGTDKEDFDTFLWMTKAGKALATNYPAAQLKLMLAK